MRKVSCLGRVIDQSQRQCAGDEEEPSRTNDVSVQPNRGARGEGRNRADWGLLYVPIFISLQVMKMKMEIMMM